MTDRPPAAGDPEPSPFTRPGFLAAAGVVLVLVVLAGFLVFTGDDDAPDATVRVGGGRSWTGSGPGSAPHTSTE